MKLKISLSQHNNLNIDRQFNYEIYLNRIKIFYCYDKFVKEIECHIDLNAGDNLLEIKLINEEKNQVKNGCFDGCHLQVDSIKINEEKIDHYGTWIVYNKNYENLEKNVKRNKTINKSVCYKSNRSYAGDGSFYYVLCLEQNNIKTKRYA